MNQLLLIFAVGLLAKPMPAQGQADFDYQTIDYPGADSTQVFGINGRGDVVGTALLEDSCFPFVYDSKDATFTNVTPVVDFDCTHLIGISNSGYMVGSVTTDEPFSRSGLILDKSDNVTVFDHPDAFSETVARAVNNDGLVTGYIDTIDPNEMRGFIYDPETKMFTDIVPSIFTIAQGINAKGDVVGSAIFLNSDDPCGLSTYPDTVRYGWRRTVDGNISYFIVNDWRTSARGITNSGKIVGFAFDRDTNNKWWGLVTKLDETPCQSITIPDTDLLTPPEADGVIVAQGINNRGEVVGWYEDVDDTAHGFIATPE